MTDRRRTKGEGTIRLRSDGRYEGREPPEIVPLGEKPRSFYGKTEQEVAKKIRQARREREQGLNTRSRQTVAAYLESWLAGPLKKSVARTTHQQYAALVRKYLIPGIGKIKLTKITAQDLDDLYADLEERGVGERTARYVHQVISAALERAAKKHLIPFNVARYADPPPMPESKEQLALTLDELSRFFEAAAGTRFENYFVVSALCGARPQEILGHSRIDQTMNTYAHVMPHIQADAFGRFSRRFSQG